MKASAEDRSTTPLGIIIDALPLVGAMLFATAVLILFPILTTVLP